MEMKKKYFVTPDHYKDEEFPTHPPTVQFIRDVFPDTDVSKYRKILSG
jgi:hypothetical protein